MNIDKTVLIAGGGGGIGSATVSLFLKNGWTVYTTILNTSCSARENEKLFQIPCDITSSTDLDCLFELISKNGKIDVVVNTVTPKLQLKTVSETTIKDYRINADVILFGGIELTLRALELMKKSGGGKILHLVSESIDTLPPRMSPYITAKYGIYGFIKSSSADLLRSGILITGVSPSFVDTSLLEVFPQKLLELERQKKKQQRFLQPSEIARVIYDISSGERVCEPGEIVRLNEVEDLS